MSEPTPAQRVLIALRLLHPPSTDPAVWHERRGRQDAAAGPLALTFSVLVALGVLLMVLGILLDDWVPLVLGLAATALGGLACRRFIRFRRRRQREQSLDAIAL